MSAGVRHDEARARGRWRLVLAVLALVWLQAATPGAAQAVLAVDLVWISKNDVDLPGTDVIEANPGDTLVLEIRITVDEAGVGSYSISVFFDEDGMDELDLVSTIEFEHPELPDLLGMVSAVDSSNGMRGRAEGFAAGTPGTGPENITIPIGEITFVVTDNVATDGDDLEGSILTLFDGYEDNFNNFVGLADLHNNPAFVPGFAAVPEPNGAFLAAAALATLAVLRNRQQSPQKTPGTLSREGR